MATEKDHISDLFDEMVEMGLVSTSNYWIRTAVDRRNPQLTLDLACSFPLIYDELDRSVVQRIGLGRN